MTFYQFKKRLDKIAGERYHTAFMEVTTYQGRDSVLWKTYISGFICILFNADPERVLNQAKELLESETKAKVSTP